MKIGNVRCGLFGLCIALAIAGTIKGDDTHSEHVSSSSKDAISPAVLRVFFEKGTRRRRESGICISRDGYIIIRNEIDLCVLPMLTGDILEIQFADGRSPVATVVGWSNEWKIALAKIDGGRWPYIPLKSEKILPGSSCVAAERLNKDNQIIFAKGMVSEVAEHWLQSSAPSSLFAPTFGCDGEFLGITTVKPYGCPYYQTRSSTILGLWDLLKTRNNVDHYRASLVSIEETTGAFAGSAREIAEATTVRIQPMDSELEKRGWSGVVLADDLVATCAHHQQLPGTKVYIHSSNDRKASGVILGTNPITDLGLVKITQKGVFPFAKLRLSRDLKADAKCYIAGYPADQESDRPLIIETQVVEPEGHIWSTILLTSPSAEDTRPGCSGGGVFDKNGNLVAIHKGKNPGQVGRHVRSEFIVAQWDDLASGKPVATAETQEQPD